MYYFCLSNIGFVDIMGISFKGSAQVSNSVFDFRPSTTNAQTKE
jgi:hypothetical protein